MSVVRRTTRTGSNDLTANLVILEYNGRQVVIPRPHGHQTLVQSIRRYLPEIPVEHEDFIFETNELPMSPGSWVGISEDAWDVVVPLVRTIKVVSSAGTRELTVPRFTSTNDNVDPGFYIRIINTTGIDIRISCSALSSIASIREHIYDREGIPPDKQRLIFAGQQLEGDRALIAYGVTSGATFQLVLRLRGGKPVIYLYPPTAMRVLMKLSLVPAWSFSTVYPVVPAKTQGLEWVVDASPNGVLKEVATGLEVSYLYWEAETTSQGLLSPPPSPRLVASGQAIPETFIPNRPTLNAANSVVISVEKITHYLDRSLNALGLHVEARTSFITYWLPSILKHSHVALRFLPQTVYERAAPLEIQPTPDVVARIFMLFKGVKETELGVWMESSARTDDPVELWRDVVGVDVEKMKEASLFRVIEWGGMEVL